MAKKKGKSGAGRTKAETGAAETPEQKSEQEKDGKAHPAEVRKKVAVLVQQDAAEMVQAVIEKGKKGLLPNVKYLLEMAGVYPPAPVSEGTEEEDSLAKTLLERLNLPTEPVKLDEDEEPVKLGSADGKDVEGGGSGADAGAGKA
jgi:hypothetical protein